MYGDVVRNVPGRVANKDGPAGQMITEYQPRALSAINILFLLRASLPSLIFHLMKRYASVFSAPEAFILDRSLTRLLTGRKRIDSNPQRFICGRRQNRIPELIRLAAIKPYWSENVVIPFGVVHAHR